MIDNNFDFAKEAIIAHEKLMQVSFSLEKDLPTSKQDAAVKYNEYTKAYDEFKKTIADLKLMRRQQKEN